MRALAFWTAAAVGVATLVVVAAWPSQLRDGSPVDLGAKLTFGFLFGVLSAALVLTLFALALALA